MYETIPDDDNRLTKLLAAFCAVYMILRRMEFTEADLLVLEAALRKLHG
jgi:hypothetical protein